jgi:hypothetical protein
MIRRAAGVRGRRRTEGQRGLGARLSNLSHRHPNILNTPSTAAA